MEGIHERVEAWIREQRERMMTSWGRVQWRMRWPPWNTAIANGRGDRKRIQQEFERRKRQLHQLCLAVKVDSVSDLQEILCCMVLSECVYKRPATEMVRAVNKFKADFGGELVSLERVQPSSDHVPHRYLLAEAGDTLFASFIGTKQYKDVMADVNILQGAVFHEDAEEEFPLEDVELSSGENGKVRGDLRWNPLESKAKNIKGRPTPAAHRGFLARAKGIPALELYRLAQKKNRKLVLCGHSLGGAVAALATLAILRVVATSSSSKETEKFQVKCITFSQPPVGNASLRDYVHRKGWQHYFKSYCIPEDVVPRMLSPAYFHHYNAQPLSANVETESIRQSELKQEEGFEYSRGQKLKENGGEPLVLGLGPVQTSFWRLSRLVPLEGLRKKFNKNTPKTVDPIEASSSSMFSTDDAVAEPQSLEIQEGSDGISLKPLIDSTIGSSDEAVSGKSSERKEQKYGDRREWRKVPALPSYVPFGKLYLLGESSVDLLSGAEYSKLTSVRSVIAELRERFQSHSMRSYRSRFHRIFEMCMGEGGSSFVGMDKLPQFPHLHQWLGLSIAGAAELAQIAESPVIRTATSLVPLGWSGLPGDKNGDPLKVDIMGFRLHLCSLIYAQVNGNWCSTTVESCPSTANYSANHEGDAELQRIRISVGAPMKRPPRHLSMADALLPVFPSIDSDTVDLNSGHIFGPDGKSIRPEGLCNFSIYCINDFTTVSKEVHVRTRRVKLIGLEGAGKTSLFKALMNHCGLTSVTKFENLHKECEVKESIAGGICYSDSDGVNLQDLKLEVSRFRDELWMGIRDLSRKTDLIILVHNLSHKIPRWSNSSGLQQQPVLSLLLDEAKALGVPWILAITNKFSVSADQQKAAIDAILQTYQASLRTSEVVNSCPYIMPTAAASASLSLAASEEDVNRKNGAQNLIYSPINLVWRPFQKKDIIFPVDGVDSLCKLAHRVLRCHEEDSLQELANDRLLAELELERALSLDANKRSQAKSSSVSAAAVGASLGAGLGLVLAIVMGAASALRKP